MFLFDLTGIERRAPSPYPVRTTGGVSGESAPFFRDFPYPDVFEVSLRFSSGEEEAVDYIDGEEFRTPFPHVFLKFPGRRYSYGFTNRHTIFFSYTAETMAKMQAQNLLPLRQLWTITLTPEINSLIHQLRELQFHTLEPFCVDRIDSVSFMLLQELLFQQDGVTIKQDFSREKILSIASYFRAHFDREIDFDRLAAKYGFSRRSFFRHWRTCFEVTPARFILDLKLEEAARKLAGGTQSIGEILRSLGFTDAAYFAEIFKRRTGQTPRAFRHLAQKP